MKMMVSLGKDKSESFQFLKNNSKTVIAHYGQSVLVEVDDQNKQEIKSKGFKIREIDDSPDIEISGYKINTSRPEVRLAKNNISSLLSKEGREYYILQLVGPMHNDWKQKLDEIGVTIYQQITDHNHYLIGIDNKNLNLLNEQNFIQSIVSYYPELKIAPSLVSKKIQSDIIENFTNNPAIESTISPSEGLTKPANDETMNTTTKIKNMRSKTEQEKGDLDIVLFDSTYHQQFKDFIISLDLKIVKAEDNRFIISTDIENMENTDKLQKIIGLPYVRRIDPYSPKRLFNELAEGVTKVSLFRNNHNIQGNDQVIAIADTGLDTGVNDQTILADFRGRIIAIHSIGRLNDASDLNGHGTHVAGSVLGDGSCSNGIVKGMAPKAKLVFQSLENSSGGLTTPTNLENLYEQAMNDGAIFHTNSWGDGCHPVFGCLNSGQYTEDSKYTDNFMFKNRNFLILFAAGNEGDRQNPTDRLVSPPGTSKNVITVGASENLRLLPHGDITLDINDSFGNPITIHDIDNEADDINHIANFSSIGPVLHNRQKPDVITPGTWIISTRSSVCIEDWITGRRVSHDKAVGYGLPNGSIFGHGDKNLPSPINFDSSFSKDYMYSSGTSMSTPITAGACVIIRQYLVNLGVQPSAALIKALLINGAVNIGHPRNIQGWGMINLEKSLLPGDSIKFDDSINNAISTGEINTYSVTVKSLPEPVVATMVWRDPPGDTIQNKLHFRLINTNTGDVFTSEDENNIQNNVQKIVIQNPITSKYEVEIEGINITNGIPELSPAVRQDYALVVSNCEKLEMV